MADIIQIKKDLKSWETEFFKLNNKKPDKNDVQNASNEIKELYSKYSKLKKLGNASIYDENNSKNENGPTEVWGSEFNRSDEMSCNVTSTEAVRSGFLDKMADKMFQNSKMIKPQKTKKNVFSKNSFCERTQTATRTVADNLSEKGEEPFKIKTNAQEDRTLHPNAHDADLAIQSFGALKNKSFSNIRNFKHTVTKSLIISETSDIPKQFCLPTKPRFTVQSMEESRKKADHFEAEMNNTEWGDNSIDMECSFTGSSLPLNTLTENSSTPSFKMPSRNNEYVDTPRPNFVKRKSSLQETLENQFGGNLPSNGVQDSEKCYDYKSDSDAESPVKTKHKKRKASGGKTTIKKQKTSETTVISKTVSTDALINSCVEEEEEREANETKSAPVRRAAPVSKRGLNENFVRLNMKAKKYKRKGGGMTGEKYKRSQWKSKMAAKSKSSGKCFTCGLPGHWSNKCPEKGKGNKKKMEKADNTPVQEEDFLSLKEAALLARGVKVVDRKVPHKVQDDHEVLETDVREDEEDDIESEIVRGPVDKPSAPLSFNALYASDVLKQTETPNEMKQALKQFGFQNFRPGQENAMKRMLCGLSTLVVLSTGEGKSLCYQLPAYVYGENSSCLTLVVSPLVSLMEDQVTGLPPGVKGACLHANMSKVQKENVFKSISEGNVHFLLVSPEAVVGGAWSTFGSFPGPDKLPPIAFVCIDEAHCLSEWSHNFRPSYLRLCKILREIYGVKCFLGLTATATKSTALDVAKHLGIEDDEDAIIRGSPVPKNLLLSVSRDSDKDEALINLLQGDRFSSCQSIIIYCTRREQANRVATYIRTCLQKPEDAQPSKTPGKKGKKIPVWSAECYHAGLTAAQRKRVQKNFMTGKLRVVVATVAFGMGLDKSDVRAVLHYNMPKSFESYVQEIGRAGRDRQVSHCHLFLDPEGKDLNELRRHTHGNTVDRFALRKLLQKVFKKCRCREVHEKFSQDQENKTDENNKNTNRICGGHERAISVEDCVMNLDIREEGIYTLLCYLELHTNRWVDILSPVYTNCQVKCYGGPSQLQQVSKKCPPLAVAIAKQKLDGVYFANSNTIEFPVVEISDSMGWESGPVKRELRQLQWSISPATGGPIRSGVMVEFSNLGFHFRSAGDLTDNELDEILDFLFERVSRQESNELYQLDLLSEALRSVSFKSYWMCADGGDEDRSNKLKKFIEEFFDNENPDQVKERNIEMPSETILNQLLSDVRQFYNLYGIEHTLTGRSISRIFHGIGSPCFPAETWGRVRRFWRSNLHVDFNICLKLISQELLKMR